MNELINFCGLVVARSWLCFGGAFFYHSNAEARSLAGDRREPKPDPKSYSARDATPPLRRITEVLTGMRRQLAEL
jgi:hypothetical protein